MSLVTRLGVFVLPSIRYPGWVEAIEEAAIAKGWQRHDPSIGDSEADDVSTFVTTSDVGTLAAFSPTAVVVVTDLPDHSLVEVVEAAARGDRANEARGRVSAPWAAASILASQGAVVVDGSGPTIELPGLGLVRSPSASIPPEAGTETGVLGMFETLPIPVGAAATWTTDHFDYPYKREFFGGGPEMDLTGRPRGLVYGPFVHLPPGVWQVEIDVSIDPEGGRVPLRMEWGAGDDFCGLSSDVALAGRYGLTLIKSFSDIAAVQMRIWLTEGIFQGRLVFHGCRVTRVADDTPVTT